MLAGVLGWPQGTFASAVEVLKEEAGGQGAVRVTREVDGGLEVRSLPQGWVVGDIKWVGSRWGKACRSKQGS